MATIQSYSPKDPADVLDYELNFGDWLVAGDAITGTPTLAVSPAGLSLGSPVVVGSAVRFYVTGGAANMTYMISATVVTTAGRTAHRSAYLPVRPR